MQPGSIVRLRDRDWILLPSEDEDIYRLRPLTGVTDDVVAVHRVLTTFIQHALPHERLQPSVFPPPSPQDLSDTASAHLLWQAARLTLRDGATPIRSLGRISIRPRVYQFVPLLMALRLDPVRLFIADDVGVGKTIEALLVARELMDRGEVRRLAVLCPPYLCDQWEKELREKFNLQAVIVRSSTIGHLERHKPPDQSIYEAYPIQVISIDWVKSDRNRHQFLQFCPELVIVDEAHGAAESSPRHIGQHQRHELLQKIAQDERRHLILLTATPHSGIETAFQSLLGLLRPEFRHWEMGSLSEPQRTDLSRHFVQRTRKDIEKNWEAEHCLPERLPADETYALSNESLKLFHHTYDLCSEIVRTGQKLEERKRRVRYWGALALLRCVMSSPAAALTALEKRAGGPEFNEEDVDYAPSVFETADDRADDETPSRAVEEVKTSLSDSEQRRLGQLARLAQELLYAPQDTKLTRCAHVIQNLLDEGFHPIVWCRYVATAEYVAEGLRRALPHDVEITAVTGRMGADERRMKIDALCSDRPRVLVATDCLSEGINLQDKFTAVLHYDLPWNPNRLEQREGRVDRYGQTARQVKAVRFYGHNNPVDGAVIEVLLNKAREIYRALGTYVPVPEESETVMQAVLNSLFLRGQKGPIQLTLFDSHVELQKFHRRWDYDTERERTNRTRFAQRALKPEEVTRELEATDAVLGDPDTVREFVLNAGQRLQLQIRPDAKDPKVHHINVSSEAKKTLPDAIRFELPEAQDGDWRISFVSPTPEGAEYVGRNHRFVSALARYLLEDALNEGKNAVVSRCGVMRTRAVNILTSLLLLRVRYLMEIPQQAPLLSEEVLVMGYRPPSVVEDPWLRDSEALRLLATAKPDANVPPGEKRELAEAVLEEIGPWHEADGQWGEASVLQKMICARLKERAHDLEERHKRIRKAVSLRVRQLKLSPQFPPDLLGILVLQPVVKL